MAFTKKPLGAGCLKIAFHRSAGPELTDQKEPLDTFIGDQLLGYIVGENGRGPFNKANVDGGRPHLGLGDPGKNLSRLLRGRLGRVERHRPDAVEMDVGRHVLRENNPIESLVQTLVPVWSEVFAVEASIDVLVSDRPPANE